MSEITVFDVIVEEAVLPSFLKVLLEFSAYDSFITKIGNTMKVMERSSWTGLNQILVVVPHK
jgi:hypothetical protein